MIIMKSNNYAGWNTFLLGAIILLASIYGVYWWFDTSDCVTSITMGDVVQTIDVSDNLKPLMCMTTAPDRYILTTAVALGFLAGFGLVVQGAVKIVQEL